MRIILSFIFIFALSEYSEASPDSCAAHVKTFRSDKSSSSYIKDLQKESHSVTLNQAIRLESILSNMPEAQRKQLFEVLSLKDMQKLASEIKKGEDGGEIAELIEKYPNIDIVLLDLIEFGNMFPGIFSAKHSVYTVPSLLKRVTNKGYQKKSSFDKYIAHNNAVISSLRFTINETIKNVIKNALEEEQGITYNRGFWQRVGNKINKWFFPFYSRVNKIRSHLQEYQKQLDRILAVDAVIVQQGLLRADELKLTDEEFEQLLELVVDSPKEMQSIVADFKTIFNDGFEYNDATAIHEINVHVLARKIKKLDRTSLLHSFDEINLNALNKLDHTLTEARARKGMPLRSAKEFLSKELQLYFGAYYRGIGKFNNQYLHYTNVSSNESYTVERRKSKKVKVGTTKDNKPIYVTRYYYVNRTVTPSFERILSGRYDTGDRSVFGLSGIKQRAQALVESEGLYRDAIDSFQNQVIEVIDSYTDISVKSINKTRILNELEASSKKAEELIVSLKQYSKWTESQILDQYSKDNIAIFYERNKWMLARIENINNMFSVLHELIIRGEPQLFITFNIWDFTDWMALLKLHRNRNYTNKALLSGTAASFGALYYFHPEFNNSVNTWLQQLPQIIENITF